MIKIKTKIQNFTLSTMYLYSLHLVHFYSQNVFIDTGNSGNLELDFYLTYEENSLGSPVLVIVRLVPK